MRCLPCIKFRHHRMQHPEGWPQAPGNMTSPRDNMSPHGMPGFPGPRPGGPQLSPRTPSPFPSVSPSGMYPPSHSPAMQSPIPPPPTKPPVPTIGKCLYSVMENR